MPLEISSHTAEAVAATRPRLRGISHRIALVLAIPLGVVSTMALPAGTPRVAGGIFAGAITTMLGCSSLLHLRPWPPRQHERLLRLDHSGIYVAIVGTIVPVAWLGLTGGWQRAMVLFAIVGAVVGIVLEWLPPALPRGVPNTLFLVMSWLPVLAVPALYRRVGAGPVALLLAGGVLYSVGAAIVGLRRPDPVPGVFGYHELWHALVLAAVALHWWMILGLAAG